MPLRSWTAFQKNSETLDVTTVMGTHLIVFLTSLLID